VFLRLGDHNLKDDIGELLDLLKEIPAKEKYQQGIMFRLQQKSNVRMPFPNPQYDPDHK
jgi:hypothetical protein